MAPQRLEQVGILFAYGSALRFAEEEGFEEGPVLEFRSVLGAVGDAFEVPGVHLTRDELSQAAWRGLQESGSIEVPQAEGKALFRQPAAKKRDPFAAHDLGIAAVRRSRTDETVTKPASRHLAKREVVIRAVDLLQFGQQFQIRPKARQCLEEATKSMRRSIENAVGGIGIVEAIPEGAVGRGALPTRGQPGIGKAANAVDQAGRRAKREDGTSLRRRRRGQRR